MLRDGIPPDIQQHLTDGFLPIVEDEVDDLNKLRRTLLLINREVRASRVSLTDIEGLSKITSVCVTILMFIDS